MFKNTKFNYRSTTYLEVLHQNGMSGFYSPVTLTSTSNTVKISSINNSQSLCLDALSFKIDNNNKNQKYKKTFKKLNWPISSTNKLLNKRFNFKDKNYLDNSIDKSLLNNKKSFNWKSFLSFNNSWFLTNKTLIIL